MRLLVLLVFLPAASAFGAEMPTGPSSTNSLGMRLVRIAPGRFAMGQTAPTLPKALWRPLSYPTREELERRFPLGDPDKLAVDLEHVRAGDFDERPVHRVTISRPFYMGVHEVTNAQYEEFDPSHRELRGKKGFSRADDEAAVFGRTELWSGYRIPWEDVKGFRVRRDGIMLDVRGEPWTTVVGPVISKAPSVNQVFQYSSRYSR